jgi:hypothetical protein
MSVLSASFSSSFRRLACRLAALTGLLGCGPSLCPAATVSTIAPEEAFAWGANVGWVHFAPNATAGVVTGTRFLSGWAWGANLGWIHLGDGAPANGWAYAQDGDDRGVNHDGLGRLSGFAYGANVGWINFSWAAANDPQAPRIDLRTGQFAGYAWGANVGWILLGTGQLRTTQFALIDTDHDFIDDAEEYRWFGNLTTAGPGTDQDRDGVSDAAEIVAGTSPVNPYEYLRVLSVQTEGGTDYTIEFTSQPGRVYRLLKAPDLTLPPAEWTDVGFGHFSPDPGATTVRTFSLPEEDVVFFRIEVRAPLSP